MRRIIWLSHCFVAATVAFSPARAPASTLYLVSVSTASIAGTAGFLDFQFNPGGDSQPAFAQLLNFTSDGIVSDPPQISGAVTGALPGTVRLDNATGFNDYFQPIVFGQGLSFFLALDGPAITSPDGTSTAGSSFGFGVFDNTETPVLTTDPNGFVATVDVNLDATTTPQIFAAADGGLPAVTIGPPVPEPRPAALIVVGIALLLRLGRIRFNCSHSGLRD